MTSLPPNNTAWGFWATIIHHADPAAAWPLAMRAIAAATTGPETAVRDFLDSRHGRHFADDVGNGLVRGLELAAAVDAAVSRWMGWRINQAEERQNGIPHGLPYLTGLVTAMEIEAEAA